MNDFISRIGTFLIVIGIFVFILFLASDFSNSPDFDYLLGAIFIFSLGWYLQGRKAPPPSAGRFGLIRGARESSRKKREEQEKARKDKEKK
jgi:hypothetical protein